MCNAGQLTAIAVPDLKTCVRDAGALKLSATARRGRQKKGNGSGKMFVQMPIGQRVSVPGGEDVMKFSVLSFTLPDLVDRNFDVVAAIRGESAIVDSMLGGAVSFNRQDSLVGSFGMSQSRLTGEQIDSLLPSVYKAVERVVMNNRHGISRDVMDEFVSKHRERKSKAAAVADDARNIFATQHHTGKIAYRNAEAFGQSFFRMEWLYKGGEMITMGPPSTGYRLGRFDASIVDRANDHGDAEFITAMLGFIKAAYESGASTVVGLQVNNTATVGRCGAIDNDLMAMLDAQRNAAHAGLNAVARISEGCQGLHDGSGIAGQEGNGYLMSAAADGSAADSSGSRKCAGCGRMAEPGQGECSCRDRKHHGN